MAEVALLDSTQLGDPTKRGHPKVQYRSYPGRFYVLAVTALMAMLQSLGWLTFGPIAEQAKQDYGFSSTELALLPGIPCMTRRGVALLSSRCGEERPGCKMKDIATPN